MRLPNLTELPNEKDVTEEFKGYNHNIRNAVGEWYDQKNMTTDYYPVASTRDKRARQLVFREKDYTVNSTDYTVENKARAIAQANGKVLSLRDIRDSNGEYVGSWLMENNELAGNISAGNTQYFITGDKTLSLTCDFNANDNWKNIYVKLGGVIAPIGACYTNRDGVSLILDIATGKYYEPHYNVLAHAVSIDMFYFKSNGVSETPIAKTNQSLIPSLYISSDNVYAYTHADWEYFEYPFKAFYHRNATHGGRLVMFEGNWNDWSQLSTYYSSDSGNVVTIRNATDLANLIQNNIYYFFDFDTSTDAYLYLELTGTEITSNATYFSGLATAEKLINLDIIANERTYKLKDLKSVSYSSNTFRAKILEPESLNNVKTLISGTTITATSIVINEYTEGDTTESVMTTKCRWFNRESNSQLVRMGGNVCAFPDGVVFDMSNSNAVSVKRIADTTTFENNKIEFITVIEDKQEASGYKRPSTYYSNAKLDGSYRLVDGIVQKYLVDSGTWVQQQTYVMVHYKDTIQAGTFLANINEGDAISIKPNSTTAPTNAIYGLFSYDQEKHEYNEINSKVLKKGDNYIIINGVVGQVSGTSISLKMEVGGTITARRKTPEMSFACESQNRIWACSKDGHEIYASALGSPFNFYDFSGLSTDSYGVNVGTDGEFTGCINFAGQPFFFKENALHYISGYYPTNNGSLDSGSYDVTTLTEFKGVEKGSEKSLAIIDNILYYKSAAGIVAYDGANTAVISDALGKTKYKNAVAGAYKNKYYVSMEDEQGNRHLFVYDTELRTWCREDDTNVLQFLPISSELIFAEKGGSDVYSVDDENITGTIDYLKEDNIDWACETGNFGYSYPNNKYLSRFQIRMQIEQGASCSVFVQYDSDGVWHKAGTVENKGIRTHLFPIVPIRCDHMKIKFAGKGDVKIISIAKIVEEGGDV